MLGSSSVAAQQEGLSSMNGRVSEGTSMTAVHVIAVILHSR
jgi:hypothetical protein